MSTPRSTSGTLSLVCHRNSVLCNTPMDIYVSKKSFNVTTDFVQRWVSLRALYLSEVVPRTSGFTGLQSWFSSDPYWRCPWM